MKSDVRTTRCTAMAIGAALALFLFAAAAPAGASAGPITISVLSGRADLVSGWQCARAHRRRELDAGPQGHRGRREPHERLRQARRRHGCRDRARAQARTQHDHRPSRRSRRAVDGHQPPEERPGLLRPAAEAVEVPGDRDGRPVRPAGEVHLRLQVDRPEQVRLPALRPGQPAFGCRDDQDRQRPHAAVHRAHRDRLPRPRPVPDRRAVPAGQALGRPWRRSRSSTTSC